MLSVSSQDLQNTRTYKNSTSTLGILITLPSKSYHTISSVDFKPVEWYIDFLFYYPIMNNDLAPELECFDLNHLTKSQPINYCLYNRISALWTNSATNLADITNEQN